MTVEEEDRREIGRVKLWAKFLWALPLAIRLALIFGVIGCIDVWFNEDGAAVNRWFIMGIWLMVFEIFYVVYTKLELPSQHMRAMYEMAFEMEEQADEQPEEPHTGGLYL